MNYLLHHILVFIYVNADCLVCEAIIATGFVSRDVFHGLNKLELLDLEHNRLSFIDSSAFSHLDQLKHARLSHNRLSFINEEFLQDSLPYMDIFGKKSPFRDCINLEYLYLANNSITEIFADWRIVLTKLRTLDLSYNRIEHLLVSNQSNKPVN